MNNESAPRDVKLSDNRLSMNFIEGLDKLTTYPNGGGQGYVTILIFGPITSLERVKTLQIW